MVYLHTWNTGLNHPVLCIEPSAEMLGIAKSRNGLKLIPATADDFLSKADTYSSQKCNKIIINMSAHLFPDPQGTFYKAYKYLPEDCLLVTTVRSKPTFPMWISLKEKFVRQVSKDEVKMQLEEAGFTVEKVTEVGTVKMTKLDWYNRLRKRVFSTLYEFSDEQIEEGLLELDREWFPGKGESDLVEIRDSITIYIATK